MTSADSGRLALPESVRVDGADVRFGVQGDGPGDLVLVHGKGAHHLWWHRIAAALGVRWRVIQLDLSGHGDSDHRSGFAPQTWAAEVLAVQAACGSARSVIVGHSMGGRVAVASAADRPDRVAGLVLLDTSILPKHRRRAVSRAESPRERVYATLVEALDHFRLLPLQPHPAESVLRPVARYSLRPVEGGWTWKHDRQGVPLMTDAYVNACAATLKVPVAYVYGELSSIVDDEMADHVRRSVPSVVAVVRVPGAHHHLVLEVPAACVQLIDLYAQEFLSQGSE